MRSATSYCNGTLYRKTMARFWPLWGLWGLGWMFLLPLHLLTLYFETSGWHGEDPKSRLLEESMAVLDFLGPGVSLALIFAVLCAMAVFGYLYTSRSVCWTHALPMRREALFTTQYLAGLSMLLLPQLAAAALAGVVELALLPSASWGRALGALLTWLLAQSGISLFFFSFAVFCAMFTGHILALPAFYLILNGLLAGVWGLLDALMSEFYYGYAGMAEVRDLVELLTPAAALSNAVWSNSESVLEAPIVIAAYALMGGVLFCAALLVYRRRHVETAGDVVAVALVRPLFKYGVSFCTGLAFGMFTAAFFNIVSIPLLIVCIVLWAVIGYFAAEMLLKKSFRVFQAWKGGAVMAVVLLALCMVCFLDLFGVVERVPKAEQVESVRIYLDMGYPSDDCQVVSCTIRDPEQIAKLIALHQAIVDGRGDSDGGYYDDTHDSTTAHFFYELAGGGRMDRTYGYVRLYAEELDTPGTVAYAMDQLAQDRELVARGYDFEGIQENSRLTSASLVRATRSSGTGNETDSDTYAFENSVYLDNFREELWEAVQRDFAEGTIGVRYLFDYSQERKENTCVTDLMFDFSVDENAGLSKEEHWKYYDRSLTITLTPQARHTLAVLDESGIWEEGYQLRTRAGTVVR